MRHAREIDDHRLAADRLAERDRQSVLGFFEILAGEEFTEIDRFAPLIGQFDADRVLRPCTTATRAEIADIERTMLVGKADDAAEDLMPGAGSSSYSVTTGPGRTLMISPLTPKSSSTPSSSRAFCSSASSEILEATSFFGSASMNRGGS